ncbi:MAG: PLP-dependent aminotransferase family protein [Solirubrobacteraceae bacterium]|jgi:DNA-binding transcriptional MocR family regulator
MSVTTSIPLSRGAPSLDIVDIDGLSEAAARAFENDPAGIAGYGTSVGYPRLRRLIAEWHGVDERRVLVTNGSMQADAFLFDELAKPGTDVVVERPSYDRTLLGLRERGALIHPIALAPDGLDVDELERQLTGGLKPAFAHIIPNFQNPAGYTISLEKRQRLLHLAREHGFLIFEDDPYVSLRFRGDTLPTMLSLDSDGDTVVYASSFSKTVCPGIRVGYLVGPAELIAKIAKRATNTYISPSMVSEAIVYEFASSGALEHSIARVREALAERCTRLVDGLAEALPQASVVAPDGGYFLWVELGGGIDSTEFVAAAGEHGVAIVDGDDFLSEGRSGAVRLSYAPVTPAEIDIALERLAAAADSLH